MSVVWLPGKSSLTRARLETRMSRTVRENPDKKRQIAIVAKDGKHVKAGRFTSDKNFHVVFLSNERELEAITVTSATATVLYQ